MCSLTIGLHLRPELTEVHMRCLMCREEPLVSEHGDKLTRCQEKMSLNIYVKKMCGVVPRLRLVLSSADRLYSEGTVPVGPGNL